MKKSFTILMLLFTTALVTSCWRTGEDWSLCPTDTPAGDDNLLLEFRVQNNFNAEFEEYIDGVDVFLFSGEKKWLESRQALDTRGNGSRSASFTVAPGTYYVVCWANVNGNSRMSVMDENSDFENSFVEIASTETGDPLYYTPYKAPSVRSAATRADESDYDIYAVDVLPGVVTVKELVFVKAHRKVELFITGFELTENYNGAGPVVEQTGAGGSFDFLRNQHGNPITLRRATEQRVVNDENMHTTAIISTLIPIAGAEDVNLYHPATGGLLVTINLEQYITSHNIADNSYVPIHVKFDMDAAVSVVMPSWIENSITGLE